MKVHRKGLGNFLNEVTQKSEKAKEAEQENDQIIYIDIDELESNPKNFYGLRNVDELAGLIAVSQLIEPLIVIKKSDGKYKIISGHRRRAAVQKLIEDGVYQERKLPCIVKTVEKISIEQENGETIEFDEDAVEMLNLIASNRGQREERTLDEKLQEIKYLEMFAKAIYNQRSKGKRGRFVNFFAEEILNISKSQLLRINSLEKLTESVRRAVDDKKISETAAIEMSSMEAEEQESCLKKILSGEMKGTVQDIQNFKLQKEEVESQPIGSSDVLTDSNTDKIESLQSESVINDKKDCDTEVKTQEIVKRDTPPPQDSRQMSEKISMGNLMDIPEEFDDPQKEAKEWFYQGRLEFYEMMYAEAKRLSQEESNKLKAEQWAIRASVAQYNIEDLKYQHNKEK